MMNLHLPFVQVLWNVLAVKYPIMLSYTHTEARVLLGLRVSAGPATPPAPLEHFSGG